MPQDFSKELKGKTPKQLEAIRDNAREQFDYIERIPKRLHPKIYETVEQIPFVGKAASKGIKSAENAVVKPLDDTQKALSKKYSQTIYEENNQYQKKVKDLEDYGKTATGNMQRSYPSQGLISRLMGVKVEKFKK